MKHTQVEYQHAEREDDEKDPEEEHVEFSGRNLSVDSFELCAMSCEVREDPQRRLAADSYFCLPRFPLTHSSHKPNALNISSE